jgi:hypothetical protein
MGGTVSGNFAAVPAFFKLAMRAEAFRVRAEETARFFLLEMVAIWQMHNFYARGGAQFFSGCNMPSTVIAHMDYYPDSATLRITFTSGEIYEYLQVPAAIYAAMKQAFSKGVYLNKFVKGKYAYRKVTRGLTS